MLDVKGQITLEQAIDEVERQRGLDVADGAGHDIERLGEAPEYGWVILGLLEQNGWLVHITKPLGGQIDGEGTPGILVIARHRHLPLVEIKLDGRTVAECAPQLLVETGRYLRLIRNADRRERGGRPACDLQGDAGDLASSETS